MRYDLPDELTVEDDGAVRTVELNCVNENLHWAFANVWRQLAADSDARVVVLTGAGRAFCAGGDLNGITSFLDDPVARDESIREGANMYLSQALGGAMQAGFAAEVVTMKSDDHRRKLAAFQQKSSRK